MSLSLQHTIVMGLTRHKMKFEENSKSTSNNDAEKDTKWRNLNLNKFHRATFRSNKLRNQFPRQDATTGATTSVRNSSQECNLPILIKMLDGRTFAFNVDPVDSIQVLKNTICVQEGHPSHSQRLVFDGKQLANAATIASYCIKPHSIVHLILTIPNPTTTSHLVVKKLYDGNTIVLDIASSDSIELVKNMIERKEGIPVSHQFLRFQGNEMEDCHQISHFALDPTSIVELVSTLRSDDDTMLEDTVIDDSTFFDAKGHAKFFDFDTSVFNRGSEVYQRPTGWRRLGLKVIGEYADDAWLGVSNGEQQQQRTRTRTRTETTSGEWPVSYAGCGRLNGSDIAEHGHTAITKVPNSRFVGVYSSPSIAVAQQFAETIEFEGKKYHVVIQYRVNPNVLVKAHSTSTTTPTTISTTSSTTTSTTTPTTTPTTTAPEEYWIVPSSDYLRPYGICYIEAASATHYQVLTQTGWCALPDAVNDTVKQVAATSETTPSATTTVKYSGKRGAVTFQYELDLEKMTQINTRTKTQRLVRRPEPTSQMVGEADAARVVDTSSNNMWQVELDYGWRSIDLDINNAIKVAMASHSVNMTLSTRGYKYVYDFNSLTQTNTMSGKIRNIRPPPSQTHKETSVSE